MSLNTSRAAAGRPSAFNSTSHTSHDGSQSHDAASQELQNPIELDDLVKSGTSRPPSTPLRGAQHTEGTASPEASQFLGNTRPEEDSCALPYFKRK